MITRSPLENIFSACDGVYFEKYATLLASLNYNSPGYSITIFVMNPSENFQELSQNYLKIFRSINVKFIIKNINLSSIDCKNYGAIYSTYRFIFFEQYITQLPRKFLFLDIDSCVRQDLSYLFNYYQNCDVSIHTRPHKNHIPENLWQALFILMVYKKNV